MTWNAHLLRWIELPTAALAVDLSRDGRTLYAACHDGVYRVDSENGENERVATHESWTSGVCVVDGENEDPVVVSSGYDGALLFTDPRDGRTIRRIQAHGFWSWQLAHSPDRRLVASVTGQYLCGSYDYKPRPSAEPTVRVFDARSGA
ncbi:MAG TPA: hypothetical protein VK116_13760, partial [Planctomycetota bacterium]|nr:hypothetical protein [Planctomycetota bacterium]